MDNIKNIFIFLSGLIVGAGVGYIVTKNRYDNLAQEEFDKYIKDNDISLSKDTDEKSVEKIEDLYDKANKAFCTYNGIKNDEKVDEDDFIFEDLEFDSSPQNKPVNKKTEGSEEEMKKPYVIHLNDFGMFDDYDTITLIYYSDGVLTDDDGKIIEDVDKLIGVESLDHMGEHFEHLLHVRNDELKCDFEIQQELRTYSEFKNSNPFLKDD